MCPAPFLFVSDTHDRLSPTRMPSPTTAGTSLTIDCEELRYNANGNVTSRRRRAGPRSTKLLAVILD